MVDVKITLKIKKLYIFYEKSETFDIIINVNERA